MADPHTDPSHATPDRITLRITFDAPTASVLQKWSDRLASAGITITGSSKRGLDVEGAISALEHTLNIEISNENHVLNVVSQPRKEVTAPLPAPMVYVPRRPTYF